MADYPEVIALIVTGSTAYTAGNNAFTAVSVDNGCKTINICGAIDAATTVILRVNSTNITLGKGANEAANCGFTYAYQVTKNDTVTVRFGGNCNILHLIVTQSAS